MLVSFVVPIGAYIVEACINNEPIDFSVAGCVHALLFRCGRAVLAMDPRMAFQRGLRGY